MEVRHCSRSLLSVASQSSSWGWFWFLQHLLSLCLRARGWEITCYCAGKSHLSSRMFTGYQITKMFIFFWVGLHGNFLQLRSYIAQPADLIEEICTIMMINFSCHPVLKYTKYTCSAMNDRYKWWISKDEFMFNTLVCDFCYDLWHDWLCHGLKQFIELMNYLLIHEYD